VASRYGKSFEKEVLMRSIQLLLAHGSARVAYLKLSAGSLLLLALALPAQAHICMEAPASRVGPTCSSASAQKPGPCGINTRSTKYVTECRPGQTLTVKINETINHDSHYRIAFNPNGAMFEDPTGIDDKDGKHPFVLLDGIKDESAARQSVQVTLPDAPCDNCTLQLIQVMYDKTGNGFGTDDIYYACADIVLKGAPTTGECAAAGDGGVAADGGMGIIGPRPAVDSGASQDPAPPAQPSDAGAEASTSGTTGADSAAPNNGPDASGTGVDGEGPDQEKDNGGCSLSAHADRESSTTRWGIFVMLATLLHRRRRRS
jgi:hypothetical protein